MKRIFIFTFLCLLYSCNVLNLDGSKPIIEIKDGAFDPNTGLDAWGYDPLSTTHVSAWNMGQGGDLKLTLPVNDGIGYMYNFTIDWGDGTVESIGSPTTAGEMLRGTSYGDGIEPSVISHDYATAGIYTIEITGTFEAWTFYDISDTPTTNDKDKLIRVHSFGDLGYEHLSSAFRDGTALEHFAGGYTQNVINMISMFWNASSLTSLDLSSFDTSNVQFMDYMFRDASGLTTLDLSNFNTSNVTNMNYMFNGASGLTSLDLTNWDTSNSPTSNTWIGGMTGTIYCNNPDSGGFGLPGSGTVNGVACN